MAKPKKYSDEYICQQIKEVMDALELERFPTHREIELFSGHNNLSKLICRRGGSKHFAELMGREWKNSHKLGSDYEKKALDDIKAETGFECCLTRETYPYDIYVGKGVKVDVKVANLREDNKSRIPHEVYIGKKNPTCDLYLIYCLDAEGKTIKRLIIPSCVLKGKMLIGIGDRSKWDIFDEKWNYFGLYDKFYNSLVEEVTTCG